MPEDLILNVSRLRVLRELATRGSIAAVADALWLTPSAVSQHLSALERETQRKLIEKAGRGVRLTAAGKLLAEQSDGVFVALDQASAALRALDTEPTGRLRVAAFPSVVRVMLPGVVARLRERYPQLVSDVEDLEGEQSLEALHMGRVDLAKARRRTRADRGPGRCRASTRPRVGQRSPAGCWAAISHVDHSPDEGGVAIAARPGPTSMSAPAFVRVLPSAVRTMSDSEGKRQLSDNCLLPASRHSRASTCAWCGKPGSTGAGSSTRRGIQRKSREGSGNGAAGALLHALPRAVRQLR